MQARRPKHGGGDQYEHCGPDELGEDADGFHGAGSFSRILRLANPPRKNFQKNFPFYA